MEQTVMGLRVILNFPKGSRHSHDFDYEFALPPHGWNMVKYAPFRRRYWDDEFLGVTVRDWEPVTHFVVYPFQDLSCWCASDALQSNWVSRFPLGPKAFCAGCWSTTAAGAASWAEMQSHLLITFALKDAGLRCKERKEPKEKIKPTRGWGQIKIISVV